MLGDGAAAYLSLCQGKKDMDAGNKSMGNVIMLLVTSGLVMAVLFALFKSQILNAVNIFSATISHYKLFEAHGIHFHPIDFSDRK